MSRVRRAARAVWEFVVGDDWRTALGVACALGITALVAASGAAAWWIMPLACLAIMATRSGVRGQFVWELPRWLGYRAPDVGRADWIRQRIWETPSFISYKG